MTPQGDLIPKSWARRRDRRRARRVWLVAGVCGVLLTSLVSGAAAWQASVVRGAAAPGIEGVFAEVEQLEQRVAAVNARCEAMRTQLRAASAFTGHPDWSILLRYLALACGDDVRISTLSLGPLDSAEGGAGFEVVVSGAAPEQRAVSGLTLKLEQAEPLHGVRIVRSRREPNAGGVTFQVRFGIGGRPAQAAGTVVEVPTP